MTLRQRDKVMIRWRDLAIPGWIEIVTDNQVSLYVAWDYYTHEVMIAGHIGGMPLMRDAAGVYRTLTDYEPIGIEALQ